MWNSASLKKAAQIKVFNIRGIVPQGWLNFLKLALKYIDRVDISV